MEGARISLEDGRRQRRSEGDARGKGESGEGGHVNGGMQGLGNGVMQMLEMSRVEMSRGWCGGEKRVMQWVMQELGTGEQSP